MLRKILGVMAGIGVLFAAPAADAAVNLTIGTVAPPGTAWASQFEKMKDAVAKATNNEVTLEFKYSQSDEVSIVNDMRNGKLSGGAVTAVGLAQIYKDVLVFQMPGLWPEDTEAGWKKLENARKQMRPQLDAGFAGQGFTILGWGDVGVSRVMSMGFEVKVPTDIQGKNTTTLNGDFIGPVFLAQVGGVTPKNMSVGELSAAINGGNVNVISAPPLAAVSLGWTSKVTNINTMTIGYGIGAIVVSASQLAKLNDDHRKLLREGGEKAGADLTGRIHAGDNAAWGTLKSRKTMYAPNDEEKAKWRAVFAATRQQLRGGTFSADMFDRVVQLSK